MGPGQAQPVWLGTSSKFGQTSLTLDRPDSERMFVQPLKLTDQHLCVIACFYSCALYCGPINFTQWC